MDKHKEQNKVTIFEHVAQHARLCARLPHCEEAVLVQERLRLPVRSHSVAVPGVPVESDGVHHQLLRQTDDR